MHVVGGVRDPLLLRQLETAGFLAHPLDLGSVGRFVRQRLEAFGLGRQWRRHSVLA